MQEDDQKQQRIVDGFQVEADIVGLIMTKYHLTDFPNTPPSPDLR